MNTAKTIDVNKFLAGYIACALWSTTDSKDAEGNETYTLDDEFDTVSEPCKAAMLSDCEDFIKANEETLIEFKAAAGINCDDYRLGFLFWLNRSGHGSGFWDELPHNHDQHELGNVLSDAASVYSTFELYGDFEKGCVCSHHYG
jgi:hypothetical protein